MRDISVIYMQLACLIAALIGVLGFLCPSLISADDTTLVCIGFVILGLTPLLSAFAILPAIKRLKRLQQQEGNTR